MRRKRLNKWRTRGRFQFQRVSGRYSDGTPDGREILYIRIRRVGCVYASTPYPDATGLLASVAYNDGTYFKAESPVAAAHQFRARLLRDLAAKGN